LCHVQGCAAGGGGRSGSNAIAERGDLTAAGACSFATATNQQNEGAIDIKYTSAQLLWTRAGKYPYLRMRAQAGPTYESQPPFVWSTSPFSNLSHEGMPDKVMLKFYLFSYISFEIDCPGRMRIYLAGKNFCR
jgi:hypothetical protein